MLTFYRRILALLLPHERRRFWMLGVLIVGMAFIELLGVASIMPFLAVLAEPRIVETNAYLAWAYGLFEFPDRTSFLLLLGGVTTVVIIVSQLFKALTTYVLLRFVRSCEVSISARLLSGYLRQPYSWFLGRNSADLGKTILSEVESFSNNVFGASLRILAYGMLITTLVGFLVFVNPIVALTGALVVGGSYAVIFLKIREKLLSMGAERMRMNTARFRFAQEAIGGIKDVKLLGLEDAYLNRYRRAARSFARAKAMAALAAELPRYLLEGVVFGAIMLLLLLLMITAQGDIGTILPTVGVFAFAGMRLFPVMNTFYRAISKLRFQGPVLDAFHEEFRTIVTPNAAASANANESAPVPLRRQLQLVDIVYRYPGSERGALERLNLSIEAGTTVGLVGATGAGKTTAVDVILGLLEPQEGELRVDGVAVGASNRRAWQRGLGYVPQQIFLIDDSVANNIALGVPPKQLDMAAVERAARIANLHDFVQQEMPEGYATLVGERGVRLSGGQRQRIGIARALYHDPSVLILDEATSALDNLTERAVMDAVNNLGGAKTIVMIAHRLSTVRDCDTIFVLEKGRCLAAGNYASLIADSETFRNLAAAAG